MRGLANHTTLVREEFPLTCHVLSGRGGENRVCCDAAIRGGRTRRIRERVRALDRSGDAEQVVTVAAVEDGVVEGRGEKGSWWDRTIGSLVSEMGV